MIDHFSILENSMKELGKILRLNAQFFGLSNENIHQLQPIIQHTQQIYEMTLNQTKSININSLRQLQQSQHLGLCSSKIFVNEDQNFDKNLNKEKLNSFKNKIDFDFSEVDSQSIYLAFLSQIALLNAIENALKILNDKFIFERANFQDEFIKSFTGRAYDYQRNILLIKNISTQWKILINTELNYVLISKYDLKKDETIDWIYKDCK
jgi:hypothetical protein